MLARPAPSTVHELLNVAKEIFNGITPPSAAETRRIQRAMSAFAAALHPLCCVAAVLLSCLNPPCSAAAASGSLLHI